MGKEKKVKKSAKEDDPDDEVKTEAKGTQGNDDGFKSKKKGGRRKKDDDWEDDVASEIASMTVDGKNAKEDNEEAFQEVENKRKEKKKTRKAVDKDEQEIVDGKIAVSAKSQRKGRLSLSDNEDESVVEKLSNVATKKGKKNTVPSDEEDEEVKPTPKAKANKKGNKGKKDDEDYDKEDDLMALASKKKSRTKSISDDSDFTPTPVKTSHAASKTVKPKSVFQLLEVEDMDVDMGSDDEPNEEDEVEDSIQSSSKGKEEKKKEEKSGKKGKKDKKKQEEDEELERMLADIEHGDTKKTKQKQKEPPPPEVEEKGVTIVTEIPEEDDDKPKKRKKKKKEVSAEEEKSAIVEDQEQGKEAPDIEDEGEEGGTVKSAAQKKKEKKERERQKKLAQKAQQEKGKKGRDDAGSGAVEESVPVDVIKPTPKKSEEENIEVDDAQAEGDEQDDGKKKKDKKGAKKTDKEDKDKKRPGKKQIIAMQEALKKMKDEEETRRLEEEAKERAAEEAEQQRLEKVRLDQERKEKRKLKEKEKRERLKAEGKLLSQSQKQQRARAAAMLESLRAQGIDVPKIGEKKERTPRPGDRIRPKKNKQEGDGGDSKEDIHDSEIQLTESPSLEQTSELTELTELTETSVAEEDVKESWDQESDDDVKDTWDGISDKQESVTDSEVKKSLSNETQVEEESDDESTKTSGSESEGSDSDSDEESDTESEDESEEDQKTTAEKLRERAFNRMQKRREDNEKNRTVDNMRSPVVCVLGHVDTGKTKILDKIRRTHVQDSEAGGITQQIGATMVPLDAIRDQTKMVKTFSSIEMKIPGLLIIDTPGHESFSNLRSRGSSLCDIAILVVDIMHGLEPQTIESINLLKQKKTPFVVALNKVDRLYEWKPCKNKDIRDTLKSQNRNTQLEFEERVKSVVVQFAEQSLNATLFYENADQRTFISLIPTSAHSGDGMGNLISLIVELTQTMMAKRLAFTEELQATVLEVKAIPGLGTTVDVILVNGTMREGDTIILAGVDGPLVTQVRSLLMPQPLKEMRVKNPYQEFKEVKGSQGVKVTGKDLEKAIAGLNLLIAHHPDEVEICKDEVAKELQSVMNSIKLAERGVFVQASTLGSLEALLEFLRTSKIPYAGIRIGPVVKKDVMKASIMLEHDSQYAVILAFDVKIERDAQDLADNLGVKIFAADIIYHLFDKFMAYREELKQKKRDQFKHVAVFPCKLRILPQFIFNTRDPIVVGVSVEAGVLREGTPLAVPSKDFLEIGTVTTIEVNHKTIDAARKGQEVCIKIEPCGGEAPKLYGRHFDHTDVVVSKITRQSIDACKEYFRDDLQKTDWQLMVELKKMFQIL